MLGDSNFGLDRMVSGPDLGDEKTLIAILISGVEWITITPNPEIFVGTLLLIFFNFEVIELGLHTYLAIKEIGPWTIS